MLCGCVEILELPQSRLWWSGMCELTITSESRFNLSLLLRVLHRLLTLGLETTPVATSTLAMSIYWKRSSGFFRITLPCPHVCYTHPTLTTILFGNLLISMGGKWKSMSHLPANRKLTKLTAKFSCPAPSWNSSIARSTSEPCLGFPVASYPDSLLHKGKVVSSFIGVSPLLSFWKMQRHVLTEMHQTV